MDYLKPIKESTLSDKTKMNYESGLRSLQAHLKAQLETIIENPDKFITAIREWCKKDTSYKVNLSLILGVFKYNKELIGKFTKEHQKWVDAFKLADEAVNKRYEENKPTERQEEGFVPYAEIIKKRDELPEGSKERVLLGMYTHIHPMRLEYARMAIYDKTVPDEPEPNYIHIKTGKMIITHFKTRKHHEPYNIKLPKQLLDDIKESLKLYPREWLFQNTLGKPYIPCDFSRWTMTIFKRLFKKTLTVALIRHAFINTIDFNKISIAEKKEIATSMGHTIATQDRYRITI